MRACTALLCLVVGTAGCGEASPAGSHLVDADAGPDASAPSAARVPSYPACPTMDTTIRPCTNDSWLVLPNVGVRGVVIEYAACSFTLQTPCSLPVRMQHNSLGFDMDRYIFCAPYTTDEYGEPLCPAFAASDGGT